MVRVECLGLTPRAVVRLHQQLARALPKWLLDDERLELGDDVGLAAELEVGADPLLARNEAQFLQPSDLGLGEVIEAEVGKGRPTPEPERLPEQNCPLARLCCPRADKQTLEANRIDLIARDTKDVTGRPGLEHI